MTLVVTKRARRSAALLLLAAGAQACARHAPPPAAESPSGPALPVVTAEVARSEAAGAVFAPGVVEARQRASLSARVRATVLELPFREGERVAQGDVLVRLDDAALEAAEAAALAALQAAQAELDRTTSLLEKGAATQRELDGASAAAAAARAGLSAARDGLSYAVLRAPFPGRVATRPVSLGDVAGPGQVLIEVEGDGGLEVRATVGGELIGELRPGVSVRAEVDGREEPLLATVRAVAPAGDAATHRFEVKASLPAGSGVRAGQFARLALASPRVEARLLLPARAVFRRGGLVGVFVVAEGRARLRWVAIGDTRDGLTEVRAGLQPGERVALDPAPLSDGVRVEEKGEPSADAGPPAVDAAAAAGRSAGARAS